MRKPWSLRVLPLLAVGALVYWLVWFFYWSPEALFRAAAKGTVADIEAVLRRGVDVNARGAVLAGPAILHAASAGRAENVRALIEHGAEVDRPNRYGNTALIMAVSKEHADTVAVLLAAGADPERTSINGQSALSIARRQRNRLLIDLLVTGRSRGGAARRGQPR